MRKTPGDQFGLCARLVIPNVFRFVLQIYNLHSKPPNKTMEILLISEKLFRENSPIQDNTNLVKFIPYIGIAQKIYIEPLLGKAVKDTN